MKEFFSFLQESPSAFHAVAAVEKRLLQAGFQKLNEYQPWKLLPGSRYYLTRNGSALIAFVLPEGDWSHFQLTASHSDSPVFKLKPLYEDLSAGYLRLNTEGYGGMIMSTWLDRPLSIAGRAVVHTEGGMETRLVDLQRDAVLIPNLAIHFNRDVNKGYAYNPQVDLLPLWGDAEDAGSLAKEIARAAGGEVLGADLFLYNRVPCSIWGARKQYFSAPRIDDLECAWTSLEAFLSSQASGHVNLYALLDNEEVGSSSKQGADSDLLGNSLERICSACGKSCIETKASIAASFMVSADNAHAIHPNHPEKYDAENRSRMNGGVVIKSNANQKYTTDAVSSAIFQEICRQAEVPVQFFSNRSDVAGGSTLGNIANTHVSMNTVDIGLAQLAMHSSYETAGTQDPIYMISALRAFWNTNIRITADDRFQLVR